MSTNQQRAYSAAHFALELDGAKKSVGMFRSIEGGSIKADVMTYQSGANYDRWRQLGKPKFEDIKLQVGMSMSEPFFEWIKAFFTGEAVRKNGAIVAADFNYNERARREFSEALIKELTFPKLDATDKNAVYMNVAMAVEAIVFKPGSGGKITNINATESKLQQLWAGCNFRFRLDGFEAQCARVSKIDAFTIKQNIVEYHAGGARAPIKCPTQVEFPQLSVYVPEADAEKFQEHLTKRVVKGEAPGRMTGMIQTFDQEKRDLFELAFAGADIVAITHDKADAGSEEIKQVKIDIYTESMTFKYFAPSVT
jgi:phage tail-like protein